MILSEWRSRLAIAVNAGSTPAVIPNQNLRTMAKNKKRTAVLGIVEELRNMKVGDIVQFPLEQYNNTSVRAAPSSALVLERANGKRWRTRVNYAEKCTDVIRVS